MDLTNHRFLPPAGDVPHPPTQRQLHQPQSRDGGHAAEERRSRRRNHHQDRRANHQRRRPIRSAIPRTRAGRDPIQSISLQHILWSKRMARNIFFIPTEVYLCMCTGNKLICCTGNGAKVDNNILYVGQTRLCLARARVPDYYK